MTLKYQLFKPSKIRNVLQKMYDLYLWLELVWQVNISHFFDVQSCFQLASLWLPEATSSSSSPGDTSTGFSPTKVLSTSESTSTSQLRSSHRPWRRHQRSSTTDHEVADESDSPLRPTLRTTEMPIDGRRTPMLEPERPRVTALI